MAEDDLGKGHYKAASCNRAHMGGLLGVGAEVTSERGQKEREGGVRRACLL